MPAVRSTSQPPHLQPAGRAYLMCSMLAHQWRCCCHQPRWLDVEQRRTSSSSAVPVSKAAAAASIPCSSGAPQSATCMISLLGHLVGHFKLAAAIIAWHAMLSELRTDSNTEHRHLLSALHCNFGKLWHDALTVAERNMPLELPPCPTPVTCIKGPALASRQQLVIVPNCSIMWLWHNVSRGGPHKQTLAGHSLVTGTGLRPVSASTSTRALLA